MRDTVLASQIPEEAIEWLWMDRIPRGMITVVAGRPGAGKSLFSALLASHITQLHEPVLVSFAEDHPNKLTRPRPRAAGAILDLVHVYRRSDRPWLPGDIDRLRARIKETGARLLVLDPVSEHLKRSIFNGQEVREALGPLATLAHETNVAVVLAHHTVKGAGREHALEPSAEHRVGSRR
jgi:predicted ATP-dependent serine protease